MKDLIRKFLGRFDSSLDRSDCVSPIMACISKDGLVSPNKLMRLGTVYGGWLIPENAGLSSDSMCYLAGAGEDISFDCELVKRFGCKVRIIDPTPKAIQHYKNLMRITKEGGKYPINNNDKEFYDIDAVDFNNIEFLPFGLSDQDVEKKFYFPKDPSHVSCSTVNLQKTTDFFTAQCYRLRTVMEKCGDKKPDLIKMDIEGGEYAVIQDMLASDLLPNILLVEFDEAHTPIDSNSTERICNHINLLIESGMRCIAVEGCNATFIKGV